MDHQWFALHQFLQRTSQALCERFDCEDDEHHCGMVAYLDDEAKVLTVCLPEFACCDWKAKVHLPWEGTPEELQEVVERSMTLEGRKRERKNV